MAARLSCQEAGAPLAAPEGPEVVTTPDRAAELVLPEGSEEDRNAAVTRSTAHDSPPAPSEETSAEPAVLLSGLVIEGRGIGVPDATVQVERHVVDAGGFGMRMVAVEPLPELTTRTDAEGRFEVRGAETGEVVVLAEKESYVLEEEVECTVPATRVTLVLGRAGAILVTVAADSLELADEVGVEVRSPGADRTVDRDVGDLRTGRLMSDAVAQVSYDVVLVGRRDRKPLHTVPGVQVRAGETTEDPRLQELDLRALLAEIRVSVVDPGGRPVPGVTVHVHHPFGTTGLPTDKDGSLALARCRSGRGRRLGARGRVAPR